MSVTLCDLFTSGICNILVTIDTRISNSAGQISNLDLIHSLMNLARGKCRLFVQGLVVDDVSTIVDIGGTAIIQEEMPDGSGSLQSCSLIDRIGWAVSTLARPDSSRDDDLISTVVVDEQGVALGLVFSTRDSIYAAITKGKGNLLACPRTPS